MIGVRTSLCRRTLPSLAESASTMLPLAAVARCNGLRRTSCRPLASSQQRSSLRGRKKKRPHFSGWVPEAYRESAILEQQRQNRISTEEEVAARRAYEVKREKEDRLYKLYNELMRLSPQYRRHFQSDDAAPRTTTEELGLVEKRLLLSSNNSIFLNQTKAVLRDIHESDAPVDEQKIVETHEGFRFLCYVLQQMCSIACSIADNNENQAEKRMYIDLGEAFLLQLVRLSQERKLLQESAEQWGNAPKRTASALTPSDDETRGGRNLISGMINRVVGKIMGSFPFGEKGKEQRSHRKVTPRSEHHDEATTEHAAHRLLRTVMTSIVSSVQNSELDSRTGENDELAWGSELDTERRMDSEAAARRMLELLDRMPSTWEPFPESMRSIMMLLAKAGTVESARKCKLVFDRHATEGHRLEYSLVLEAYLEATNNEPDKEKQQQAAKEALDILNSHWDTAFPTHRVDRIVHSSIVLQCLAVAIRGISPELCELGEILTKRTLSDEVYEQLKEEIRKDSPRVDTQVLPLLNSLAQLFVASGTEPNVIAAKQTLNYMMHHGNEGGSRFVASPTVVTCNAVLFALINSARDAEAGKSDLDFAMKVLDYMYGRGDSQCWPTSLTHKHIFRLLRKINPENGVDVVERLLSTFEARHLHSTRSNVPNMTLTTYHRVLRYWLEMVETSANETTTERRTSSIPCEKAFQLLETLSVQSTPLLLNDRALTKTAIPTLYDPKLRPVRTTYTLVLEICEKTKDDLETAAKIALEVCRLMIRRGIAIGSYHLGVVMKCASQLAQDSAKRKEIEEFMAMIDTLETESKTA